MLLKKSAFRPAMVASLVAMSLCLCSGSFASEQEQAGHEGQHDHAAHQHDAHAHHKHMMQQKGFVRSEHNYAIPDVLLKDQNGKSVSLPEILTDSDRPVMLNFIFTTCTTICPVLSASFSQFQEALGDEADEVRMVSISIDPEYDTPEKLRDYAKRFHAGDNWVFYTGNLPDIVAVQKAFDVYRGDKMNHPPVSFMRARPDAPWIRIEGFASIEDLMHEYHNETARPQPGDS
jgi:protein SCO1/2